uniref:Uncharacterized protein n=1 Tax=Cucumis sativus TaxID=3659 RepID=A0A0A0KVC3_CUCSA
MNSTVLSSSRDFSQRRHSLFNLNNLRTFKLHDDLFLFRQVKSTNDLVIRGRRRRTATRANRKRKRQSRNNGAYRFIGTRMKMRTSTSNFSGGMVESNHRSLSNPLNQFLIAFTMSRDKFTNKLFSGGEIKGLRRFRRGIFTPIENGGFKSQIWNHR